MTVYYINDSASRYPHPGVLSTYSKRKTGWYFRLKHDTPVGPYKTRKLARDAQFKAKSGVPLLALMP